MQPIKAIKKFLGYGNDDYYGEDVHPDREDASDYYDSSDEGAQSDNDLGRTGTVMSLNSRPQVKVVLVKPTSFSEVTAIADYLNKKRTVVLNLEIASKEDSRRLIDFLSGVAYANDGALQRVANSTYLITSHNVDLQGDSLGELADSGGFFGG